MLSGSRTSAMTFILPPLGVRGENPTVSDRVKSRRMHRGREAGDQGQGIHFHGDRADNIITLPPQVGGTLPLLRQ
jgi:hypothetical protein